eukprot:3519132-Amphidinium_carterae.1
MVKRKLQRQAQSFAVVCWRRWTFVLGECCESLDIRRSRMLHGLDEQDMLAMCLRCEDVVLLRYGDICPAVGILIEA